jgi:DNA polymerase-3 subunit epsilon
VIAIVDTETTGLDPSKHEVVDVHVLLVTDDLECVVAEAGSRTPLLNPEAADATALEVNGYCEEAWKEARPLEEVLPPVVALLGCAETWVGSNPEFDEAFLALAVQDHLDNPGRSLAKFPGNLVDTRRLAKADGIGGGCGLDSLCARLDVQVGVAHTARGDCLRVLEVLRRLREVGA